MEVRYLFKYFFVLLVFSNLSFADNKSIKIGVASVLSGDLAVLGKTAVNTSKIYKKYFQTQNLEFVYEDAKLSSVDGLKAYQKLINIDKVDLILAACTSNATMAAKTLINTSKTPTISISTGGENIDNAGQYVFRIGNSDTLNGYQQAEALIKNNITKVALLTEETEYTQDISKAFQNKFKELGGKLTFDSSFIPSQTEFRTEITLIKKSNPEAIFMPTQTGTALGLFLKQWNTQGGKDVQIHTTFVAAPNPDAHRIAGELINGVYYMSPDYDKQNPKLIKFFNHYRNEFNEDPPIAFHAAGIVDSLSLLEEYLKINDTYSPSGFSQYLVESIKNYKGLLGIYSFDKKGNSDLGFSLAQIKYDK